MYVQLVSADSFEHNIKKKVDWRQEIICVPSASSAS